MTPPMTTLYYITMSVLLHWGTAVCEGLDLR
jgi:hypothetical protein